MKSEIYNPNSTYFRVISLKFDVPCGSWKLTDLHLTWPGIVLTEELFRPHRGKLNAVDWLVRGWSD